MFEMQSGSVYAADDFSRNQMTPSQNESDSKELRQVFPKILVVDDERHIADSLTEILEMAGFHVMTAYDGCEAVETALKFQPDYLLTDVLMPKMNGVELAIAVRKMFPAARILLFSGQTGIAEILQDAQKRGFEFELIAKPIHPLQLIEHLKTGQ